MSSLSSAEKDGCSAGGACGRISRALPCIKPSSSKNTLSLIPPWVVLPRRDLLCRLWRALELLMVDIGVMGVMMLPRGLKWDPKP